MRHATILVAILAFVPLTSATAQVPVRPGARVRLTPVSDSPRFEAIVIAVHDDSLTIEHGGVPRVIPLDLFRKLEIGTQHRFDTRRGLKGAGIGALGGAVLAALTLADCGLGSASIGGECDQNVGESILLGAGAAVGGALIGGAFEGGGRAARRGGLVGAAIGAPIGLVMGLATYEPCPSADCILDFGPVVAALGGAIVGAMAGGLIGLLAGAVVPSTDWLEIPGHLTRVSLVPRRHGVDLGVTLSF